MQIKRSTVGNCVRMKRSKIVREAKKRETKLTQKYGNSGGGLQTWPMLSQSLKWLMLRYRRRHFADVYFETVSH